jgi:glycerophosphoryl diester phosphodiesterase
LTARPVGHRGLHDGITAIENTASAVRAAIDANYAVEVDLQITADGEAMVHHDDVLGRLTEGTGDLHAMTAADLKQVPFKSSDDRMMTLGELLDLVAGRVTLLLEMKSRFAGDSRLVSRVADVLTAYAGPVAAMSFDPEQITLLKSLAPGLPRGIVAERHYRGGEWEALSPSQRHNLALSRHAFRTRPHFIAYRVHDLPAMAPLFARHIFGVRLLTWTVRNEADRRRAATWADQMIFEGLRP